MIKTKLKTFFLLLNEGCCYGAIQLLRSAVCHVGFPGEKRYEGVRFNIISVTSGVSGCQIS